MAETLTETQGEPGSLPLAAQRVRATETYVRALLLVYTAIRIEEIRRKGRNAS